LIVGAGGFGREVLAWARDAWPDHADRIAGFLSDDLRCLDNYSTGVAVVGPVAGYAKQPGDYLVFGIGVPYVRRRVAEALMELNASFLTLAHPTAVIAASASIGEGSVVCPYAILSDSARLGRFALVNYHSSLGHDAVAGDFSVLSPYATLGGNAAIAEDVFLGLHASVGPGKSIGARSKISANSAALSQAPPDSLIFGVPGRIALRLETT